MKKLTLAIALILFTGFAAAIYNPNGSNECPPGEMCVMNKAAPHDAAAPTSASGGGSPDSNYSVEFNVTGKTCATGNQNDSVQKGDYSSQESMPPTHIAEFNGTVITSNPCQELDYNITYEGGVYTMNIYSQQPENQTACTSCIGAVSYESEFRAQTEYFQLNIQHNNETVSSFAPPQDINEGGLANNSSSSEDNATEQPGNDENKSFFSGIMNWFRSLF